MANIFPAILAPERIAVFQFNLAQRRRVRCVSVLVQSQRTAFADREIAVSDSVPVRIGRNAVPVQRIVLAPGEPHFDPDCRVGLWRLIERSNHREPVGDRIAGGDSPRGDRRDSDQIGAEHVVVLDDELDVRDRVSERDREPLGPDRVLRVGDDSRARHAGSGEADRHVRVAGDDPPVAVLVETLAAIPVASERRVACLEGGEELPESLRDQIHIGQAASLDDLQVEVAVEVNLRLRIIVVRHWISGARVR